MICTTIINKNYEDIISAIEQLEMAEIRLDKCPLTEEEIGNLFSFSDTPLIATCRIEEVKNQQECSIKEAAKICEKKLLIAIKAGAAFIDLEIEAPQTMSKRLTKAAKEYGSTIIRSFHDYKGMANTEELTQIIEKYHNYGAEIVKIAVCAQQKDFNEVLKLNCKNNTLAFLMGEKGKESRMECLKHGAPFTYAALSEKEKAADGQWTTENMRKTLYGEKFGKLGGSIITISCSKSYAQRAILAAALADGRSVLHKYTSCEDNEAAINVAHSLGAKIEVKGSDIYIEGTGGEKTSLNSINVGESGLVARLSIPLLAHLNDKECIVEGKKTLLNRPLKDANDIMAAFGSILICEKPLCLPLKIQGDIIPGKAEITGKNGSQLISGLLMTLPLTEKSSSIRVIEPKSIPYIFMTLDILKKFGIKVFNEMEGNEMFVETGDWDLCTSIFFKIAGKQKYHPAEITIEGDWSTAANLMVAGAIFGVAKIKGLNMNSLQADISIIDILTEAGASVSQTEEENPIITVQKSPLKAFEVDESNYPDLFPITAILAAFAEGTSRISGLERLIDKESNRKETLLEMLDKMGVTAYSDEYKLVIEGHSLAWRILNNSLLKGGNYKSYGDHRIVMALTVAELGSDSRINIDNKECVSKSCPDFFEMFNTLIKEN